MRRVSIGFRPCFLAQGQRARFSEAFGGDETLQRCQPMFVVARAIIGFTAVRRALEFLRQRRRPLLPREMPLLGELDSEREGLRLPGLGKHWASLVSEKMRPGRERR